MKLYNSLTKKLEDVKPISKGKIGLYTCGPTVYDHVHIGNLRTYIFEDTLRRALRSSGYKLKHVMNITDVDDKTIKRSRELYPNDEPLVALKKLATQYEVIFLADAKKIGIDFSQTTIARATEHIEDMHNLIRAISNKYLTDDGIYFDIAKSKNYGQLVKLDNAHTQQRIDNDEYDKEHAADFALWKAKKFNEPAWDFKLEGKNLAGHPGWHIECSAMSVKYLGQPFDIHTGGVDLKFPHHENEIAQSRAAGDKPLANYFVHAEHLIVDGRKMSKSLKNFYVLDDVIKKGFSPMAFRMLVLQAHYRTQLNLSWNSLEAAQSFLSRLCAWADLQFQGLKTKNSDSAFNKTLTNIKENLDDDLNTPKALAALSQLVSGSEDGGVDSTSLPKLLQKLDDIFGLNLSERKDVTNEQKQMISDREAAREQKDFNKSDQLRDELVKQGIGVKDNQHGQTWYRILVIPAFEPESSAV